MRSLALILTAAFACAQEPRFSTRARLVLVPVTVSDPKGHFAVGLTGDDFLLLDDGRPQAIRVDTVDTGVAPVALVIAVQTSGISAASLEKVRKVGSMIQPLVTGARGCAAVVSFHSYVRLLQECTSDPDRLEAAFAGLHLGDPKGGRLIDAIHTSLEYLATRAGARKIILLISESRDRGSELELDSAIPKAQAADVVVFAITYSAFKTGFTSKTARTPDPPRPQIERPKGTESEPLSPQGHIPVPTPAERMDILGGIEELVRLGRARATDALARATGGTTWSFARQQGLETAIANFGAEIQSQYVLSFTPAISEAGYHRLEVRLRRPDQQLQIRARPGYWSVAQRVHD